MTMSRLAPIRSWLEQFVFAVYNDFRYRVGPFVNFRVTEDLEEGS